MFFSGVILLGCMSFSRLKVELFPNVSYSQITVSTQYQGASPEEIENLITIPVEETVGTVSGVKKVESYSREGKSIVLISFHWNTDMNLAALRVREKLDLIMDRLPREAQDPVITKFNPFQKPVAVLNLSGNLSLEELRVTAKEMIKDQLEKIEGVASVEVIGGREREIKVLVDHKRLQASGYSLLNVVDSINGANLDYPAGAIEDNYYEYLLRVVGRFQRVDDIGKVPLFFDAKDERYKYLTQLQSQEQEGRPTASATRHGDLKGVKVGQIVLLKDVAQVEDGFKEVTSYSRYNFADSVQININKQSDANTIAVSNRIKAQLLELKQMVGQGVQIDLIYDESEFIRNAINSMTQSGMIGTLLAFIVLLFFLKSARQALIMTCIVPISVLAIFIFMYLFHVSLNIMSLGGIVLSIGTLVDCAIVVIENIARVQPEYRDRREAAIKGAEEVYLSITASTLTTIAVFIPVIFIEGLAGQFFKELAITVTCGQLASLGVSVSLIPVLFLKFGGRRRIRFGQHSVLTETAVVETRARRLKKIGSLFPVFSLLLCVGIAFLIFLTARIFPHLEKQLLPHVDQKEFLVSVRTPSGTPVERTNGYMKRIEDKIKDFPGLKRVLVRIGSDESKTTEVHALKDNEGEIRVLLDESVPATQTVVDTLRGRIDADPSLASLKVRFDARENVLEDNALLEKPVKILVQGYDLTNLKQVSQGVLKSLQNIPGITDIETSLEDSHPETRITVNRDTAAILGLHVRDVALLARTAVHGQKATEFRHEGEETDITVKLADKDTQSFEQVRELNVYSPALKRMVPLKQVALVSHALGPEEIYRLEQSRTVKITANVKDRSLQDVEKDIDRLIAGSSPPAEITVTPAGEDEEVKKSFQNLSMALGLSVVFIYMILAAQFQSYLQPLIILTMIPLSLIGVIWTLFLTGKGLNVIAVLGCIMLGGIVVNNGIILMEFITQQVARKRPAVEAAWEAVRIRLRPILMTSLTTILGLLPIAFGIGQGAQIQAPMAVVVIGGLMIALVLTILVIPVLYVWIEKIKWLLR